MSIPLVQEATKDAINTSIIAIKRNIERINMLLGLSNSEEIDTSKFATKEELQQAVTDLQPVDEVALNNMQSVSSNAVARDCIKREVMQWLYSNKTSYWFKIGQFKPYTAGAEHFPFVMIEIDIMGYYREDNIGKFFICIGIYDRSSVTRRITRKDILQNGTASVAVSVDNELNVWVQPIAHYGSAFSLRMINSRDFNYDFQQGAYADYNTVAGFTSLGLLTSAGSMTF